MNLLQSIHELPRNEKLKVMESIWEDLSSEGTGFESPEWHRNALMETENRFDSGKEEIIAWEDAKKELRKNFDET